MKVDPLKKLYVLRRIVRRTKLENLEGKALLAQDFYDMASMLALFLKDLTGETMPEPDDLGNERGRELKRKIYSDLFDYNTRKTRRAIIQHFLLEQFTRLIIMVEGQTQQKVIKMIFEALKIDTELEGIMVYVYEGIDNLRSKNVKGLLQLAKEEHIPVFIFADDENKSKAKIEKLLKDYKNDTNMFRIMYRIWNKDFEQENLNG